MAIRAQIHIIQGIPYWISQDNKVYLFNNSQNPDLSLLIGTFLPERNTVALNGDWKKTATPVLDSYRSTIQPVQRSEYTKIQKFSKKPRTSRQNARKKTTATQNS